MSFIEGIWPGSKYAPEGSTETACCRKIDYATRAKFLWSVYTFIREEYSEVPSE